MQMQSTGKARTAVRAGAGAGRCLLALAALAATMGPLGPAAAPAYAVSSATMAQYTAYPPFVDTSGGGQVRPRFLISMSRDEQLFFQAYNGLQDLNGDGKRDLTYRSDVKYDGYFDPDKCYRYLTGNVSKKFGNGVNAVQATGFFEPRDFSGADSLGAYNYDCTGSTGARWSGNYLNWATMTRLDLLRKVLYGGLRMADGTARVILQGAIVPPDPHAFAKLLSGTVTIRQVTPLNNVSQLTSCRVSQAVGAATRSESWTFRYGGRFGGLATRDNPDVLFARGNFLFWDFVSAGAGRACLHGTLGLADFATDYPAIHGDLGSPEQGAPTTFSGITGVGPTFDRLRRNHFIAQIRSRYVATSGNIEAPTTFQNVPHDLQVQVCVANLINADNNENCKRYSANAGQKPIGILQEYGEAGLAEFGLFTGSYGKHKTGGVLRKRLGAFDDEIETSGVLKDVDLTSYPDDGRIIWTLDNLVLAGFQYYPGRIPNFSSAGGNGIYVCTQEYSYPFIQDCVSWGNPLGEIFYESVAYLAGAEALAAYDVDDTALGSSVFDNNRLPRVSYGNNDSLMTAAASACEPLNVLLISSGTLTNDGDDLPTSRAYGASLPGQSFFGATEIKSYTKQIGESGNENIEGNMYMVGASGTDANYACSPKTVNDLSEVRGLCPEGPTLDGSFLIAGAAYYAHTEDLRPDLNGEQTVNTVALDLRPALPEIWVPVGAALGAGVPSVLIQPAYQSHDKTLATGGSVDPAIYVPGSSTEVRPSGGRLAKFIPVVDHELQSPGVYRGLYILGWDDSIAGTDYDHDHLLTLEYVMNVSANTIEVTTDEISQSSGHGRHLIGFTIQGTTQDGFHAFAGTTRGFATYGPSEYDNPYNTIPSCGYNRGGVDLRGRQPNPPHDEHGCRTEDAAVGHTFTVGASTAQNLQPPLYYAAKYGGFKDSNGNDKPDLVSEWDTVDVLGNAGADGLPDNYLPVTNPNNIRASLVQALEQGGVSQRTASGTAAALVANEREGLGAVFQALFEPARTDNLTGATPPSVTVSWLGTLQALFVDVNSLFREDSNQDGALGDYQTDKVVQLFYDQAQGETRVNRFDSSQANTFVSSNVDTVTLSELNALWNARERMEVVASDAGVNRAYDTTGAATGNRFILTWLEDPANANGIAETTEVKAFTGSSFTIPDNLLGSLDVGPYDNPSDPANFRNEANNALAVIGYLRGRPAAAGQRPRALAYKSTDTTRTEQLLGDIVHSSPVAVAAPAESYDLLANDSTYTDFRRQWGHRRQVVYVGANDGMLHGFNAGFYRAASDSFTLDSPDDTPGDSVTQHALGDELWAYVPRALHPHLKWLADPSYTHGYYVDSPPRVFDVRAFTAGGDHPGGWGTILVVGFRLGGGGKNPSVVDIQRDGIGAANTDNDPSDDQQFRSAFVVMDITNPEEEPELIAELSHPEMGFTTARPVVVPVRGAAPADDKWYLVLGSGPDDRSTGNIDANANARLFVYDLAVLIGSSTSPRSVAAARIFTIASATGQFVGGITVSDFDLDLRAEALYFGTVGNSTDTGRGDLYRLHIGERTDVANWDAPFVLLDAGKPFFAEPTLAVDAAGNRWVYAGSGRLLADGDEQSTAQQTLYGIIDVNDPFTNPGTTTARLEGGLVDVSNARVLTNGQVDLDGDGTLDQTFGGVRAQVAVTALPNPRGGWKRDYRSGSPTAPSQRTLNASTLLASVLFNTAFSPPATASTAACAGGGLGDSELLGLDFRSGLPQPQGVLGTQACAFSVCSDEVTEALGSFNLGHGLASLPSLHLGQPGEDVPGRLTVVVQQSTGEIQSIEALGLNPADSGEVSWQEYLE